VTRTLDEEQSGVVRVLKSVDVGRCVRSTAEAALGEVGPASERSTVHHSLNVERQSGPGGRVGAGRSLREGSESRPGHGRVDAESCLVGGVTLGSIVSTDVDNSIRWQRRCAVWLCSCVGRSHVRQSSLISVYVDLFWL